MRSTIAASFATLVMAVAATPAAHAAAVYDPSSPAGDQYSDPFAQGRSAGGGGHGARTTAPLPSASRGGGPPTQSATAVAPFGQGVTPRPSAGAAPTSAKQQRSSAGAATRAASRSRARRTARARRATSATAADRAVATREIASVDKSPTGLRIQIALIAALAVLAVTAIAATGVARWRRRPT